MSLKRISKLIKENWGNDYKKIHPKAIKAVKDAFLNTTEKTVGNSKIFQKLAKQLCECYKLEPVKLYDMTAMSTSLGLDLQTNSDWIKINFVNNFSTRNIVNFLGSFMVYKLLKEGKTPTVRKSVGWSLSLLKLSLPKRFNKLKLR